MENQNFSIIPEQGRNKNARDSKRSNYDRKMSKREGKLAKEISF